VVVTLLAVLELVRQGRIRAQQTELFGEIVLERSSAAPTLSPPGAPDA
jgi:chromatin segregation and condensation protein Rec8/ScpA/Scc1 (kleisin family)